MNKVLRAVGDFFKTLDKTLLFICLSCSAISAFCLYSLHITNYLPTWKPLIIQLVAVALGVTAALVMSKIDYEIMAKLWKFHMPLAILLVLLTFTPLGVKATELADDKAWLNIGFTTIQPSELLKLSFIFTFSLHLEKVGEDMNKLKPFLLLCLHGAVPIGLIMLQGDFGTALVFTMIFISMMFVAGLSLKLIAVGAVSGVIALAVAWVYILPDYLRERFFVALHPENYLSGKGRGWQQYNGRIALGSGQITGRGYNNQNLYWVSEAHNDFIFSYIGQIMGFIGIIITLLLITALCVKILMTSRMSKDSLGSYICVGVFSMFFFQTLISIGMVLCVTPVIGITLPFFSAGGTSAAVSYLGVGMVLSVYRHNKKDMMFD